MLQAHTRFWWLLKGTKQPHASGSLCAQLPLTAFSAWLMAHSSILSLNGHFLIWRGLLNCHTHCNYPHHSLSFMVLSTICNYPAICWFICLKPASTTGLGIPWTRGGTHPVHPWSLHTQHPGATQRLPKHWMEEDGWPNKTVCKVSMAPCGNNLFLPPNELQQFTKVKSNPPLARVEVLSKR